MVKGGKFTQEEELLLQDFSRDLSKKTMIMFYLNALIVSSLQVCEYKLLPFLDFLII